MDKIFHRFNGMKILVHQDRLLAASKDPHLNGGVLPNPIDWHVYPTNACNHKCVWCMFRQNGEQFENRASIDRELLLRFVGDAAAYGGRTIQFIGGGEPLLNPHVPEAIDIAGRIGLSVSLTTNGSFLTPEIAEHTDFIRVSLNAGTPESHYAVNHGGEGRGDWEDILDRLRKAAERRKRDLGLAFVVDHRNVEDIRPFCALAADIRADFVHIRPAFWFDGEEDRRTRETWPRAMVIVEEARSEHANRLQIYAGAEKFEGYWTPRVYDRCRAVLTGVVLTATGDFAACLDRTDLRFGAGYREGADFEEIWQSEEHRALVASITSPGALDKCPRCVWNYRNEIIENVFVKDEMRLAVI